MVWCESVGKMDGSKPVVLELEEGYLKKFTKAVAAVGVRYS